MATISFLLDITGPWVWVHSLRAALPHGRFPLKREAPADEAEADQGAFACVGTLFLLVEMETSNETHFWGVSLF